MFFLGIISVATWADVQWNTACVVLFATNVLVSKTTSSWYLHDLILFRIHATKRSLPWQRADIDKYLPTSSFIVEFNDNPHKFTIDLLPSFVGSLAFQTRFYVCVIVRLERVRFLSQFWTINRCLAWQNIVNHYLH